jgi:phosphohistidine phosphatase
MAARPDASATQLLLWRHAEAEDGVPDATRALTPKGRKQARAVAKWLRKRLPGGCRILVSPAVRAQQTAAALDLPFETSRRVDVGASAGAVLEAAGWPAGGGAALVVGHQPTLGRAAALALDGTAADWSIRKGAVWWLTRRVRDGAAEVVLRAVIGPDLLS